MKYINNEVYFDVVEEIDVIIDKLGRCCAGIKDRGRLFFLSAGIMMYL